MKKFALALVLTGIAAAGQPMFADALGTTVTASLYLNGSTVNSFDPDHGNVPSGDANSLGTTLTITDGLTLGSQSGLNLYTAVFTGTTLAVTSLEPLSAAPFEMDFTDADFIGVTEIAGLGNYTTSLVGDTLKVNFLGGAGLNLFLADVDCDDPGSSTGSTGVTPEPTSIALMGTGLLGCIGTMRRRYA